MKKIIVLIVALVLLLTVGTVGASAAERYGAFEYYVSDGEAHILRCHDNMGGTVVFPDTIEGCKVVSISGDVFDYDVGSEVKSIVLSDGVTKIEPNTFENMDDLETVVLPDGLLEIGESAFAFSGIKEITIPAGVTKLPSQVFRYCDKLQRITIQGEISEIGYMAFAECFQLRELVLHSPNRDSDRGIMVGEHIFGSTELVGGPELTVTIYGDISAASMFVDCYGREDSLTIFGEYGSLVEWYAMIGGNDFSPIDSSTFYKSYHFWSWVGLIVAVLLVLLLIFLVIRRIRKKRKLKKQQKEGTCAEQQADWQFGFQEPDTVVGQASTQSDSSQTVERAPTESPAATMRYCGKCGTQNLDTAAFCRQCGQSMAHK